jgi:hypothetical protein
MYEIIGINYERAQAAPSVFRRQGRTPDVLDGAYQHGKDLWDGGNCSKYIVALFYHGEMVDYNRPDYWSFKNKPKYTYETRHFTHWDYSLDLCPYKERYDYDGEARKYLTQMCATYQEIIEEELCKYSRYRIGG